MSSQLREADYVYLDHAATSPLRASARAAMTRAWDLVGNASAVHGPGRAARRAVEDARDQIAASLGAHPTEVVFTAGGTEADNLAICGTLRALAQTSQAPPHVVTSAIEHAAVLGAAALGATGVGSEPIVLPVGPEGFVSPQVVREALGSAPALADVLVSIQAANSEFGTVQDLAGLVAAAHEWHLGRAGQEGRLVLHSDAVQALGQLPLDFGASGLDAISLSGHKVGGPTGSGILLVRRGAPIEAVAGGGGQERGLRPGTYDVAGIVGLAAAIAEAAQAQAAEALRLAALRDELATALLAIDGVALTGPGLTDTLPSGGPARLPANLHVRVAAARSELLLFALDAAHVAAAAGSACHAGVTTASRAVLALGIDEQGAAGSLRLTLGHTSSHADIEALAAAWPQAVASAREASGAVPAGSGSVR